MKIKRKYTILLALGILVIVSDQITKALILYKFRWLESIPVWPGFFNLTQIHNTGAAFGILADANPIFRIPFFVVVPTVALLAIATIFRKISDGDLKLAIALSLVVGGAFGNLIDRIYLGYVIDFLDFHWGEMYHFPAFNLADSAICVGVGVLMFDLITEGHEKEGRKPNASTAI